MSDDPKKPVVHLLPAILTGSAALIASLTAVYVNVRNDREAAAQQAAQAPVHVEEVVKDAAPVIPQAPAKPDRFRLQLDRMAVRHDGAMGTANWRFTVEAAGEPLLTFGEDDLDDSGGRNVVLPKDVASRLRVVPGSNTAITVKAWRNRRLRLGEGEPDALGEGVLTGDGTIAPLAVDAKDADKGSFVLYFSATPEPH